MSPWRKSSYSFSNGGCTEVAAWRKSSHSHANGNCTEVGQDLAVVGVRDSQLAESAVLTFGGEVWAAFTARLKTDGI